MYYVIIDCGTTNSRAYVVNEVGKVYGLAKKTVGVRDTSITGSKDRLRAGLREIVTKAIIDSGIPKEKIIAVLSSGMITSEIGIYEIPHLMAPCGVKELAASITKVDDAGIIDGVPVYFVRGIKNYMVPDEKRSSLQTGEVDFMRGEETQIAGLMTRPEVKLPAVAVILSSHTKFVAIDEKDTIRGSLTTLSGQLFDAVKNGTFVGKSVERRGSSDICPENYFDETIIRDAIGWIDKVGLCRALMFPRFMDVLLHTRWYERMLFYDALVAAEDMRCIGQLDMFSLELPERYYLIGKAERCRLYEFILKEKKQGLQISSISGDLNVDALSINGILEISKKAGIVK